MNAQETDPIQIDQFILAEYPYPIAELYRRVIEAEQAEQRIRACIATFEIFLRTIVLEILTSYLTQSPVKVNHAELNRLLYKRFAQPSLGQWVDFLFMSLRAYQGNLDLLPIPELYDLFWDVTKQPHEFRAKFRQPFTKIVEIRNTLVHKREPESDEAWEKMEKDACNSLRQILFAFKFLEYYDLIRISGIIDKEYYFERYSSQEISFHSTSIIGREKLEDGRFYFVPRTELVDK